MYPQLSPFLGSISFFFFRGRQYMRATAVCARTVRMDRRDCCYCLRIAYIPFFRLYRRIRPQASRSPLFAKAGGPIINQAMHAAVAPPHRFKWRNSFIKAVHLSRLLSCESACPPKERESGRKCKAIHHFRGENTLRRQGLGVTPT